MKPVFASAQITNKPKESHMNKTHYKDFFKSNTLQDNSFDPANDTIVTIVSVQEQELQTKDGKQVHLTANLASFDKPLRINKTIAKNIAKALKTPDVTQWAGKQVAIYIEKGLRAFGEVYDVPRVRPIAPRVNIDVNLYFAEMDQVDSVEALRDLFAKFPANVKSDQRIITKSQTIAKQLKGDK